MMGLELQQLELQHKLPLEKQMMGAQKKTIQKRYEINVGQDSINIDFLGSNRQFDWLEISMVYDKSDKHTTIYHS